MTPHCPGCPWLTWHPVMCQQAENEQLRKKCDELTLKLEEAQAKLTEAEGAE